MFRLKRLKHWSKGNIANENEGSMLMMMAAFRLEQSDFNELIFWFPTFPAEGYETIWNRFVIVFSPSASLPLTTICHFIFISKKFTRRRRRRWTFEFKTHPQTRQQKNLMGLPRSPTILFLFASRDTETRDLRCLDILARTKFKIEQVKH